MQGTFEQPEFGQEIGEDDEENGPTDGSGGNHGTGEGDAAEMETDAPKRPRLDAMANVPWRSLAPANDRETQQRMREHHGQEAKYMSLTDDKRVYVPKVSPYPEGPDDVFPGNPCYKITVNGRVRHIFVLDPDSPGYPLDWGGQCRRQSSARWIVPHFIYRDEGLVNLFKNRWKQVYTYNSTLPVPIAPPPKDIYVSTVLPALPAGALYPLVTDESYYVRGEPNPNASAPEITDPLLTPPFNTNGKFVHHNTISPFPYNQDPGVFPQRVAPHPVYRPQAVPAIVVPAAPAAPAPAGRGRGRGAPPPLASPTGGCSTTSGWSWRTGEAG